MRNVIWVVKSQTLVDTEDDDIARDQVAQLFDGQEWGELDGRRLCVATVQAMAITAITDPADAEKMP